jgi:hypothetical protein
VHDWCARKVQVLQSVGNAVENGPYERRFQNHSVIVDNGLKRPGAHNLAHNLGDLVIDHCPHDIEYARMSAGENTPNR